MRNRIDKSLSAADIQDVANAIQSIHDKVLTEKGLTNTERKKGGWYLSPNALQLLEASLVHAKLKPANFPHADLPALERDITLIKQLQNIESQLQVLKSIASDNRRLLIKDAAEQGLYIYNSLKLMYDSGVPDGVVYEQLKPFLPRTGKKNKPKS